MRCIMGRMHVTGRFCSGTKYMGSEEQDILRVFASKGCMVRSWRYPRVCRPPDWPHIIRNVALAEYNAAGIPSEGSRPTNSRLRRHDIGSRHYLTGTSLASDRRPSKRKPDMFKRTEHPSPPSRCCRVYPTIFLIAKSAQGRTVVLAHAV